MTRSRTHSHGPSARAWSALVACAAALALNAPPVGARQHPARPAVLFVPGWCAGAHSWNSTFDFLLKKDPARFGTQALQVYYDGTTVRRLDSGAPVPKSDPTLGGVRLFAIDFYHSGFNKESVSQVPIEAKVVELKNVIRAIADLTGERSVVLVGHSMGGLVARAYVQNKGAVGFDADVSKIVTIDTPHQGSELANFSLMHERILSAGTEAASLLGFDVSCITNRTADKSELAIGSRFLTSLNTPLKTDLGVTFVSIASWHRDRPKGDGVVDYASQNLAAVYPSDRRVRLVDNRLAVDDIIAAKLLVAPELLHVLSHSLPSTSELIYQELVNAESAR
jgi:pimeloyl-ACP methyl ester carboxylesterase